MAEARAVLVEGARRVGDDVRNSLDFHATREGSAGPERLVLTGPAVAIGGFCDEVAARIGLPFEVGLVAEAKPGVGMLAVMSGAPVVPAYVSGTLEALPKGAVRPRRSQE